VLPLVIEGERLPHMPTPTELSVTQLRARALRLLEMAVEFEGDPMGRLLREQAAQLDVQADALERKTEQ
jgi:hypothetical protein